MAVDLTQQRAVSLCPTPTAHRRVEVVDADANAGYAKACAASRVPDDDDTDAGQEPHRGMPPMPMPMLARCHIDGSRRRWCQRRPCQSMRRVEGSVPDDDDTDAGQVPHRWTPPMQLPMPMLAMCRIDGRRRPRRDDDDVDDQHESGSFSPGDLGLPSAPGFSAIHQLTGDKPVGAGSGICEGRCWGSTPRFSSFLCARLRTTFRRAQPRIASVLRHRRGSTTIHQRPGQ